MSWYKILNLWKSYISDIKAHEVLDCRRKKKNGNTGLQWLKLDLYITLITEIN